jgi:hypothetical protein
MEYLAFNTPVMMELKIPEVRFQVLKAASMQMAVSWVASPCRLVSIIMVMK